MTRRRSVMLIAAATAVGAAGVAALVLVDEELTPEARSLYDRPTRAFVRDSGWAYLVGFDAPAGVDPRDHAVAGTATTREERVRRASRTPSGDGLTVRAAPELLCQPQTQDCVRAFAARLQAVDTMAADNAILLARYDALLRSTGLADVVHGIDPHDAFHSGAVLLGIQRVRLSQVGAAAARGRLDPALQWLEADAAFHRRWLDEADTFLTKMLALRTFTRTVTVAAQIARAAPKLSHAQGQTLERITAPLGKREQGMAATIRTEAVLFSERLDEMMAGPRADLASRTLRRNATLNFAAPLFAGRMQLDDVESHDLPAALERTRAAERAHLEPGWRWVQNYHGRALTADSHFDIARYLYRLRDAGALTAMMRCVVRLRAHGIAEASAAGAVAADPACRDPYLARAFAWDPAKAELSFRPQDEPSVERYGGSNGRVRFAPYAR